VVSLCIEAIIITALLPHGEDVSTAASAATDRTTFCYRRRPEKVAGGCSTDIDPSASAAYYRLPLSMGLNVSQINQHSIVIAEDRGTA
jgi:hypothetical protein